jgi:tRNA modification GTPase
MKLSTTIFAVSSGLGRAGIAVVRLSGPQSKAILGLLVATVPEPRMAGLRRLVHQGELIDQALVLWFPGPNSVSGEDLVEFHVHGSPAVLSRLFSAFGTFEGVEPALAGEFTRRAFDNGRLDLVEVEGLADLLAADSEVQRKLAIRQFVGESSGLIESWRSRVIEISALVEAAIDFADEDAEIGTVVDSLAPRVTSLIADLQLALDQSEVGVDLRNGLRLVFAGAPNVGKSSLFNWLLNRDAAIVSAQSGTTRDVVSAGGRLAGLPVLLADTAGLRDQTEDEIEKLGMTRSLNEVRDADILIWVRAPGIPETVRPGRCPDLVVNNKSDLVAGESIHVRNESETWVSSLSGDGLDDLRQKIDDIVKQRYAGAENSVLVRQRHRVAVLKTIRHLNEFLRPGGKSVELRAEDLRRAARELAAITGRVDVEDLLGKIFSEFCIGK